MINASLLELASLALFDASDGSESGSKEALHNLPNQSNDVFCNRHDAHSSSSEALV